MLRHIVWWTLKENANGHNAKENAKTLVEASELLKGIASLRSLEVSCQIQNTTTVPVQLILTSTHEDMAGLQAYAEDPVHLEFAKRIKEVASSRSCIDYEVFV